MYIFDIFVPQYVDQCVSTNAIINHDIAEVNQIDWTLANVLAGNLLVIVFFLMCACAL